MLALSPGILIIPIFSLVLVSILYLHFYKKVADTSNYKRMILTIALVGFVLNLIWELVHGPLYKDYKYDWDHIPFCVLASITDMLTLLLMLFGFGIWYKNIFWIKQFSFCKVFLIMLAGGLGTTFLEMWHIDRGDWSYGLSMPLIPIVRVGVSPVLQFTILPLIIFITSKSVHKLINENFKNKTNINISQQSDN